MPISFTHHTVVLEGLIKDHGFCCQWLTTTLKALKRRKEWTQCHENNVLKYLNLKMKVFCSKTDALALTKLRLWKAWPAEHISWGLRKDEQQSTGLNWKTLNIPVSKNQKEYSVWLQLSKEILSSFQIKHENSSWKYTTGSKELKFKGKQNRVLLRVGIPVIILIK